MAALIRSGYMANPIVYRSIRMISEPAASIPLLLYRGEEEISDHWIQRLLDKPNVRHTYANFFEAIYDSLLISGNAYIEGVALEDEWKELHTLKPGRVRILTDQNGWPSAYEYKVNARKRLYSCDSDDAVSLLHIASHNPLDDHYGFSPLEAAAVPIDIHNKAANWNKALLHNSARPSGALVYETKIGTNLTPEQFKRLKAELEVGFSGAGNAGRPLLLEGGLDWKPMGLSPKDMDFMEAKNSAAREIALAFGVPPMLLGIPGDNTYSNFQEANKSLWRQTVIPLVKRTSERLGAWLAAKAGDDKLRLGFDLDNVEALGDDLQAKWSRIQACEFLSVNEKRTFIGYSPVEGGDDLPNKKNFL